ncbi:MAG: phosphoribosylanthranilate isomerase [Betaproteobacteria bacterium]|nr:phosphoribosylanthranilate isomerase [Pseudomonadota bacterium]NBO11520.1 phosphoribosylanthranilate isomerase [Betaproteobacteria bacterium]NBO44100.1 phosphoribosylanthranilate isomerase [Betaproteobacteria bacterium]NBP11079.1 phosphoribosylanthranilate isomerase [Betaproteobacteria bacterium]NBP62848.1 phosphoribosylanthranilate isomerase [Betaproteobacteria bacterium]
MTLIKFCGLVRSEDVEVAGRLGVDYAGFVLYAKSPRALQLEQAHELRKRLPSFMRCVGLFVNAHPLYVQAAHQRLGLDVIQFHGDESPQSCLEAAPVAFWRAVRMQNRESLALAMGAFARAGVQASGAQTEIVAVAHTRPCEAFLVDADARTAYGGSGQIFDWSWLALPAQRPERLILSGGLTPENVQSALLAVQPWAVDVSSGIQGASPRRKDAGKMEAFVHAVRAHGQSKAAAHSFQREADG